MITMIRIIKAMGDVEDMLLRNITRTLVELEMHRLMSNEQILKYYNVKDGFDESDRNRLIEDTMNNLEGDIYKLEFYQKNKEKLQKAYGKNYDKIGGIKEIAQQRVRETMRKSGISNKPKENASAATTESNQGDHGPNDNETKTGNPTVGSNSK